MKCKRLLVGISIMVALSGLLAAMLSAAPDTIAAESSLATGSLQPAQHMIQGRVYEGNCCVEPPQSSPLRGVTVSLFCSSYHAVKGQLLRSAVTDSEGYYELTVQEGCGYYNIVETNPPDYTSAGATTPAGL